MTITVDFSDGAYLLIEEFGNRCVYEDNELDFEGNLKETLKVVPEVKKREITQGLLSMNNCGFIGVRYDKDREGFKAIGRSG